MRLRPGEQFPITWRVSVPDDSETYYVQAKIRNSRTRALLATVNLTDNSDGSHSTNWTVPQDTSGLGFYVDIEVTVYTDSGHNTKSANYQIENNQYQIKEEQVSFGGGSVEVDYKKIAEMVSEAVAKEMGNMPKPTDPAMHLNDLYSRLDTMQFAIQDDLKGMDKEDCKPEFAKMEKSLDDMEKAILGAIQSLPSMEDHEMSYGKMAGLVESIKGDIMQLSDSLGEELQARKDFRKFKESIQSLSKMFDHGGMTEVKEEKPDNIRDISKFLSEDE